MLNKKIKKMLIDADKKQQDLVNASGATKQGISKKFSNNTFTAYDLALLAEICGYELAFIDEKTGVKIPIEVSDFSKEGVK